MDLISNPGVGSMYNESKLVVFDWNSATKNVLSNGVRTYENINYEINKFLKDGWIPVNVCFSNSSYTILFCR